MKLDVCIQKIEKYLSSADTQFRFVNVQNVDDLSKLKQHFHVGSNIFKQIADYCKEDENPRIDSLLDDLVHQNGNVFLTGFMTCLKLQGEEELKRQLSRLVHQTAVTCHIVVLCYQCTNYLSFSDSRLDRLIYSVDGDDTQKPELIFVTPEFPTPNGATVVDGIHHVAEVIETSTVKMLYIKTRKQRNSYRYSLYSITEENKAFNALCKLDANTSSLRMEYGTEAQWSYALSKISKSKSWAAYFTEIFGGYSNLELMASNWKCFNDNKKWLYFIALKLYGAKNSWCLNIASQEVSAVDKLIRHVFRSILSVEWNASDFWEKYTQRKALLVSFGNPGDEVLDYCAIVKSKGKYAIYYLTDSTRIEKELIFEILDKYGLDFTQNEIVSILRNIYPDLHAYLLPFRFKNDLLDSYFQIYKYEKVINKIFPEFEALVDVQAQKRDFNLILPTRTEKVEAIKKENTQLYFMDAMGVEFLGFIMEKCRQKGLIANVTVCRAELPSLTFCNKEFVEEFSSAGSSVISIKKLDDIKHHGEENFDYQQTKLPIHLIRELEIIEDTLNNIKIKLVKDICDRAVMIADHGASRLAVIRENTLDVDVNSKGTHGGRVCEYNADVAQISCATQAGEFYVLANYDRFKGGRAASVETHGGATLEEVTIPIIEITYCSADIEIKILTPLIIVSFRKKAEIQMFSKTRLGDISICVAGKYYDAEPIDDNRFLVKMPDLKQANEYMVDVYSNNNLVASGLKFAIQKESSKERNLL